MNVQDSTEFASQVLNRDVWSNHNVKEVIRQHFLFWQVGLCLGGAVTYTISLLSDEGKKRGGDWEGGRG